MKTVETVRQILEWAHEKIGPASGPIVPHNCPDGDGEILLVRDGYEVERFEGQRRRVCSHRFTDLETFAAWLNARANPARTDILLGDTAVVADLDPHAHHADIVECLLVQHPRLRRWSKMFGQKLTQKKFHRLVVSAPEDFDAEPIGKKGAEVGQGELLAMQIGKLAIAKDGKWESEIDERGTTRFSASSDKTNITGQLPPRFHITVPFFVGVYNPEKADGEMRECEYSLEIHLDLDASGDVPMFELSCPSAPVVARTALLDARTWLEDCLDEAFMVSIGARGDRVVPA